MKRLLLSGTFEDWQQQARYALAKEWSPQEVLWEMEAGVCALLRLFEDMDSDAPQPDLPRRKVPKAFIALAEKIVRHSSPARWELLYRTLWRLTHGEPHLLQNPVDSDYIKLIHLEKEVKKDAYRMMAFIRFREVAVEGKQWFVAWYEPEHDTVDLNAEFFANRFSNMRWSILTPSKCMHWDGEQISLTEGVSKASAPKEDHVEALWISYYSKIFNPARLKIRAMQAQLLKRNWKNLPEAAVIEPLIRSAANQVNTMLEESDFLRPKEDDFSPAPVPIGATWQQLKKAASTCHACPLWKQASCTVFGEGPVEASIMLVGEQPGDQEDREGKPFIGPAGQLLDRALQDASVDRSMAYVTNAVKHFKFEPRGKRRVHKSANIREIRGCRPWLEAEVNLVRPQLMVSLGRTAALSLFDADMKVSETRGSILPNRYNIPTLITVHPSSLLRLPEGADFQTEYLRFVGDLRLAKV